MPRLVQSVPRFRKHKASGQAIVEINGKRHYLGPHGTKAIRLEYDRHITEWLASGRPPLFGVPEQQFSVAEVLVAYLSYAKKYCGDSRKSEFVQMLRTVRPLRRLYGREPARTFDGLKLKAVRQQYIDAGNSRLYVNTSVKRLVRVFRWAASEGPIPPDVRAVLGLVPSLRCGKSESAEGRKVNHEWSCWYRFVDGGHVEIGRPGDTSCWRCSSASATIAVRTGRACSIRHSFPNWPRKPAPIVP